MSHHTSTIDSATTAFTQVEGRSKESLGSRRNIDQINAQPMIYKFQNSNMQRDYCSMKQIWTNQFTLIYSICTIVIMMMTLIAIFEGILAITGKTEEQYSGFIPDSKLSKIVRIAQKNWNFKFSLTYCI